MTHRGKSSTLLVVTAAVVALVSAPAAEARATCQTAGGTTTTCQTNGSTSIKVVPGTTAPPAYTVAFPWFGRRW
ncbi:hypothetical protein B1790_19325 [Mycobacterium sp. AT1]|nr:hypothetical protein B1790_19325 [Mycobacterium sp. AT1]